VSFETCERNEQIFQLEIVPTYSHALIQPKPEVTMKKKTAKERERLSPSNLFANRINASKGRGSSTQGRTLVSK
jgi:hypothetical protein